MSASQQEKEKLRKKLQKLFQQELSKQHGTGKVGQQPKDKMDKQKSRNPKDHNQVYSNKPEVNKSIKKDQQSTKHSKKDVSNTNGSVHKTPKKQKSNSIMTKSGGLAFKKDETKESKLQQKGDSTANKISNKRTSLKKPTKKSNPQKHDIRNQLEDNTNLKKSVQKNKIKKDQKMQNKNVKNLHSKSGHTSMLKENISLTNGKAKIDKSNKKVAEKRTAVIPENKRSKKKIKLNKKTKTANKNIVKPNKKQKNIYVESDSPSSQSDEEYDINGMTGYVRGGDFDTNNDDDAMEHKYWKLGEDYSENEYSSDNIPEENNDAQKFNNNVQKDLEQYDHNGLSESDYEHFDSEDDSYEEENSYEEEDENYSDFDENDYEEDEDCYSYTTESDDYSSESYGNEMSYSFDDLYSDEDYELPKHVPEDLIIHKGTATVRDLMPDDNVVFDNENVDSQIVELENQHSVKIIYQPKITINDKKDTAKEIENCPKLIPISVDEDDFQLYNPNSEMNDEYILQENEEQSVDESEEQSFEGSEHQSMEDYEEGNTDDASFISEYMEVGSDDANSLLSEDINEKYLNKDFGDGDSVSSIDVNIWNKKHKVEIIDATGYQYENENNVDNSTDHSDTDFNDVTQIPSIKLYENVDLKTETTIFSTTINDNVLSDKDINEYKETELASKREEPHEEVAVTANESITELQSKIGKSRGQKSGDYNTHFFNAFGTNSVIVLLKDPFYIYGTVRLTLLAGEVEVYGHSLVLNKEVEIFSPRGCSMIEISSKNGHAKPSSKESLKFSLKTFEHQFALRDLKRIVKKYNSETDAVVLLKRNESRKKIVQQFKKFMNENVFPNINNIKVDRPLYNTEYILRCMINTSALDQKCLLLPKQWQELSITSGSCVMLAGGKNVGKSTLLRYLINRHLPKEILLIDLDIGQPEVFIPQTVSCTIIKQPLLGPGFLHNLQPEMSYAVGHSNIVLCAHKYIDAVRSLIAHCKAEKKYKEMPWLINTMGYNKGFGLELISVIAQELPLTDVVQLQSTREINNFDSILYDHVLNTVPKIFFAEQSVYKEHNFKEKLSYRLHVWQSAVEQQSRYQKEWEMSPKDIRFAILLARLRDALQGHADWLTDVKPLGVSLNDLKIINLMENTPTTAADDLAKSIEANLVYLCYYEADLMPLRCLGIGVVRAIDYHVRQLYLVPALPYSKLKDVNCLAIGEMPLPTSLFTNQGPKVKNIAPFIYNTIAANASKAIKQIYHRPPKFLTGKRKSTD